MLFFSKGCNRTYYGNIGVTYDLELHRPKEDKLPYICILTFSAAGGIHGDIVQVKFITILNFPYYSKSCNFSSCLGYTRELHIGQIFIVHTEWLPRWLPANI